VSNAAKTLAPTVNAAPTPNTLLAAGVPAPVVAFSAAQPMADRSTPTPEHVGTSTAVVSHPMSASLFFAPGTHARTAQTSSDSRPSVFVAPVPCAGIPGLFSPTGAFLGLIGPGGLLIGNGVLPGQNGGLLMGNGADGGLGQDGGRGGLLFGNGGNGGMGTLSHPTGGNGGSAGLFGNGGDGGFGYSPEITAGPVYGGSGRKGGKRGILMGKGGEGGGGSDALSTGGASQIGRA
jgi:hypothetical protein